MSTTYKTTTGDTLAIVARKVYGSETYASLVASANPGAAEPLTPGTVLTTPPSADAPDGAAQTAPSASPNEVALLVGGKRFRFWTEISVTRSLDAMDTIEFSAPFDADAPGFREAFRPFSYKPVQVTVGGELLFKGTMVSVVPSVTPERKTLSVGGYSRPGVLNDCTPPSSAYPLEFNNVALPEIAATLCYPFGIAVQFETDGGTAFERVAINPGSTILPFIASLARQRAHVVSSTPTGRLLFQTSADGAPVAVLAQGASPVLSVTPFFQPQQYFSHVTGLEPVVMGLKGSSFTVKNPHLEGSFRPFTFSPPDVEGGDIEAAVTAKAGRMFGNMAAYSVELNTWRAPDGELWAPNTTVVLEAPDAMIYSAYTFVIRSVQFSKDSTSETATLELVLPGSFSGEIPETLPWD